MSALHVSRHIVVACAILLASPALRRLHAQERPSRGASGPTAALSVILGRPTNHAITLSLLSTGDIEACVVYGLQPGAWAVTSAVQTAHARVPVEFELNPLEANARYGYRLLTRTVGARDFRCEPDGTFQTQRAAGSTFTFALQGDSHPEREGKMYDPALYAQTMRNVAKSQPDFYFMMGDDFSIERLIARQALSQSAVDQVYAFQRSYLGMIGRCASLFLVNGNHEQAALCNLNDTPDNAAVLAGRARMHFFPLPAATGFYTGDAEEIKALGSPRDYYAWTWGDALFVVIDFYWHSPVAVANEPGEEGHEPTGQRDPVARKRDLWAVTLGDAQYHWLSKTLTTSQARWKFVFCHHVLGTGRGGVEMAMLGEWGGFDRRGGDLFAAKRPEWELPIHRLMVKTGVTIFFQGHDHVFARQELDGIVYQSCPNPADATFQAFNREAYRSGTVLPNSGHLRMTVAPETVSVEYIRSWRPADETAGHTNGEIACHYSIPSRAGSTGNTTSTARR